MSRLLAAISLLLCSVVAQSADRPQRIVSLNFCTDELLLALVPAERIASLTWLARSDGTDAEREMAARLPVNHGSAAEVLAARPDLVLAGRFTTANTRALLARAGIDVVVVDAAQDWPAIRRVTRAVAAAVGEPARGEALLARMDATLAEVESTRVAQPVRAIGWSGSAEDVPGADTLFNVILTTAGAINIAARPIGPRGFGLEQILRARPQLLLRGTSSGADRSLRRGVADHPVLRAVPELAVIEYPEGAWACGVPSAADHALALARTLRDLPASSADR